MNVFTALTVIAIVAIIANTIKAIAVGRGPKPVKNQIPPELEQQVEQLKERVAALEAIVTDKNYDLSKEIDRL